jgi:hypothetical protein
MQGIGERQCALAAALLSDAVHHQDAYISDARMCAKLSRVAIAGFHDGSQYAQPKSVCLFPHGHLIFHR